jgi:hypothetical protein
MCQIAWGLVIGDFMLVLMRKFLFYLTKIKHAFNIHKPDRQTGNAFFNEIYRTESRYIM